MPTSYYHYDALGSTRELTNSAGDVTDSYIYNAWGEEVAKTGTSINPFRWVGNVGYSYDGDTDNYYVRARNYSPAQARWLSVDPIGYIGSKLNLYEYVGGNPVTLLDPSGEITERAGVCFIACMLGFTEKEARDIWKNWGKAKISRRTIIKKIGKKIGKKVIPFIGPILGLYDLCKCTAKCF